MLNMQTDTHGIATHANMGGDTQESISACPANLKLPDLSGSTRPCPGQNGWAREMPRHAEGKKRPANMSETSVMRDLPTRCAEPRTDEPKKLKSPTDALDVCMHTQSIADDSIRPTDN